MKLKSIFTIFALLFAANSFADDSCDDACIDHLLRGIESQHYSLGNDPFRL